MKKWLKYLLIILAILIILVVIVGMKMGFIWTPTNLQKPVPAPQVSGKIKGYWSSEGPTTFNELNDAKEMKAVGINTITFSAMLSHDKEGRVREFPTSESYIKKTINKAHENGFRVMLETTPMNSGQVAPRVTNPKLFQDGMTKIALKYAKIAEQYHVEFFAPIVEPGHHMDEAEADAWLQELLPKLRQVYKGKIMWKKQSTDLEKPKPWNVDHILTIGFKLSNQSMMLKLKQTMEQSLSLDISSKTINLQKHLNKNDSSKMQDSKNLGSKNISLSDGWHELAVRTEGNLIAISLDNEKVIEATDDSGSMGGYAFSGQAQINKVKVTDLAGKVLFNEEFKNLNSWSTQGGGIKLGSNEIEILGTDEVKFIHDIDFSGYDYIAIDTYHRGRAQTIDEYIDFLKYYIQKTNDQAKADGVPNVILAEFGGSLKEDVGWQDADQRAKIPLTEDELAQTTQRVLEMAEKEVDGYIYNGWNINKQGINKLPKVKKVISDWYNNH